ncbi:MAG: hypothetical protein F6J98_21880 [Moorea sp. SIO4G2]|uniref:hypothetical protein n=1 Tax=unclassified Moorena TaxID=2683338 RepID=UPI0013F7E623|nr:MULTISPECIES: hypothetical protein [unclassified Moorena]NEO17739.1 hypothetical protein [Moorena sp. SIO3E8]NEO62940.1 hypothetical protein [Moorena sp. SIO4G2]NEQ04129.1 hypothetical protein [Moorena sp. SIO3F7]
MGAKTLHGKSQPQIFPDSRAGSSTPVKGLGKSAGLLPLRPRRTVRTSLQVHGATDSF